MAEDIYVKLGERLNKNFMRMPLGEPVLAFLRKVFTEEHAAIGANLPMGAHSLSHLSRVLHRDPNELYAIFDKMADKGLIFIHVNGSGEKEYSLPPFFPGIVEFQSMRGTETEEDIDIAHTIRKMMAYLNELGKDLFNNPDAANKIIPAALRTLTVERELPQDSTTILPFEQVSAIIEKETSFATVYCHCRHNEKLTGNPCAIPNVPERTCFYFGEVADFMIEREFAKRITKEECMGILKKCEEAGLVHNINNYLGRTLVLCNCCSCCCDFLVRMKKYRGLRSIAPSNFIVSVDQENCIGCGTCISRCQMEALSLEDDTVSLTESYCIGCGNCVSTCPEDALKMIRHSDHKPIELKFEFPGLGL